MWKASYKEWDLHSLPLQIPWLLEAKPTCKPGFPLEAQSSSCPYSKVMALSGLVNIPRLQGVPAKQQGLPVQQSSHSAHRSTVEMFHLRWEHIPSGGDWEVTIHTAGWERRLQRQSLSLPYGVLSTAATLGPCHKVKAPPSPLLPKAFSISGPHPSQLHALSSPPSTEAALQRLSHTQRMLKVAQCVTVPKATCAAEGYFCNQG